LIAQAAAEINRESGRLVLSMSQGIYQNDNPQVLNREIENAFDSSEHANNIFQGTVWGISYTNQAFTEANAAMELIHKIREKMERARKLGIKIGARVHNCDDLISAKSSQSTKEALKTLALELDYIMCLSYSWHVNQEEVEPSKVAELIGQKYKSWIASFHQVNPALVVILGETGWPSSGKSESGPASSSTIRNLYTFWTEMGKWAARNKLQVNLFEAFDEPWKSDPNDAKGKFGTGGHFGWWRRTDNNDWKAYAEKILGSPY